MVVAEEERWENPPLSPWVFSAAPEKESKRNRQSRSASSRAATSLTGNPAAKKVCACNLKKISSFHQHKVIWLNSVRPTSYLWFWHHISSATFLPRGFYESVGEWKERGKYWYRIFSPELRKREQTSSHYFWHGSRRRGVSDNGDATPPRSDRRGLEHQEASFFLSAQMRNGVYREFFAFLQSV